MARCIDLVGTPVTFSALHTPRWAPARQGLRSAHREDGEAAAGARRQALRAIRAAGLRARRRAGLWGLTMFIGSSKKRKSWVPVEAYIQTFDKGVRSHIRW